MNKTQPDFRSGEIGETMGRHSSYLISKRALPVVLLAACCVMGLAGALIMPSPALAQPQDQGVARSSLDENTVTTEDGSVLIWKEDGDSAKITGYVSLTSDLIIPSEIEGRPVIALADYVMAGAIMPNSTFANCTELETVELPDTMLILSGMDFMGCTNLKSIKMSPNIAYIGLAAFQGCSSLESIELPAELRTIDQVVFTECSSLTSISIPEKVTSIGDGAFAACSSLKSVTFSEGLETIGAGAFDGTALERVDLPDGLTEIGATAFRTESLMIAYIPSSVDGIGEDAFGRDVIVLTDENATRVRMWAQREDMTYVAGTLADYDNPRYISRADYTGEPYEPEIVLHNSHYDEFPMELAAVTYKDNVDAGTATYVVTSDIVEGEYVGTFEIDRVYLSASNVVIEDIPTQKYVGIPLEPEVRITFNGAPLVEGRDFEVTYANNSQNSGTGRAYVDGIGNFRGSRSLSFVIVPGETTDPGVEPEPPAGKIPMYRCYNPWTGEHFYTASGEEYYNLCFAPGGGWIAEGVGWTAPASGAPVYRLYNPFAEGGDHHYTISFDERVHLTSLGWRYEGVGWYSASDSMGNPNPGAKPLYRQFNPYARTGTHNYTASKEENDHLVSVGWRKEGIGWYGL